MTRKSHPVYSIFQNHRKCNFSDIYFMKTVCFMRASVKQFCNIITDPLEPSWGPAIAFLKTKHNFFVSRPYTRDQRAPQTSNKKTQNLQGGASKNNPTNVLSYKIFLLILLSFQQIKHTMLIDAFCVIIGAQIWHPNRILLPNVSYCMITQIATLRIFMNKYKISLTKFLPLESFKI